MLNKFKYIIGFILCISLLHGQGFTNIAEEFGLDFSYLSSDYGGGCSFVDFDQDGLDDLSFTSQQGLDPFFYRNTGAGFEKIDLVEDTSETKQLLWVDYNNDGLLDLYINSSSKNSLYKNIGNLELVEVTKLVGLDFPDLKSYCATWFDYDNDGKLDLMVAHRTPDRNGWVDLYKNVDYETFVKRTIPAGLDSKGASVLAMTIIDFNNDGWQDVFLAQDWMKGNSLFRNNGDGTFKDVSKTAGVDYKMNSMTATVMDINEDGWQDIYVTNTTDGNRLFENQQDDTFEEKSDYYKLGLTNITFGTSFTDLDNDGDDDVIIVGQQVNYVFENIDNQEAFVRRNQDWGMGTDRDFNNGLAVGDLDNNGFQDFARNSVTRGNLIVSKNSIWRNDFKNNNYLKIQLEGTISNLNGIGAIVTIYSNGKSQMKRIACGESFNSQHSLVQHFGVGENNAIDSIEVKWPAGNISQFYDIQVNNILQIKEPKLGCTDPSACNFNPAAEGDNGTCRYPAEYYTCEGCISDTDGDGVCDQNEIYGCNEIDACNYSQNVTENDGTCYYLETPEIYGQQEAKALFEMTYSLINEGYSDYIWKVENGTILSGNGTQNVKVLWYESEEGILNLRVMDDNDCSSKDATLRVVILDEETLDEVPIEIYPNPAYEELHFIGLNNTDYEYEIFDAMGRKVQNGTITEDEMTIKLNLLITGIYRISIIKNNLALVFPFYKE